MLNSRSIRYVGFDLVSNPKVSSVDLHAKACSGFLLWQAIAPQYEVKRTRCEGMSF